jgi:hypothetical protein
VAGGQHSPLLRTSAHITPVLVGYGFHDFGMELHRVLLVYGL